MKLICKKCKHTEKSVLDVIIKIIGGSMPTGGFLAWKFYLFAGSGFALPIVSALILGGSGLLIFKDQIVEWIVNKNYHCPNCNAIAWEA